MYSGLLYVNTELIRWIIGCLFQHQVSPLVTSIDINRELVTHIRIIANNTSVGSTVCQYHGRLQDVKRLRCIRARAGLVSQISKDYNTVGMWFHSILVSAKTKLQTPAHRMTKLIVLKQSLYHMRTNALFRAHNLTKASTHPMMTDAMRHD